MGTIVVGAILGLFLVLLLVVLVLLMNPPNRWVQRLSKEELDEENKPEGR